MCTRLRTHKIFVAEHLVDRSIPDVAASYNNIANIYDDQGKYEEALEYYQKDLEITVRPVGQDHPDVAVSYQNLAAVYQSQGNHVQTKEMTTGLMHTIYSLRS